MSHINHISIKHFRGIDCLVQNFGDEKFIVLIGRGDSGKSTILSAISATLSPSWNLTFSDLDFYMQDTANPIEIEITLSQLPTELLRESKFGLYVSNSLDSDCEQSELSIILNLRVDDTLEPHWTVKSRPESDIEDKPISAHDRAFLAVNYIADYTDNQFSYNKQSPLYAFTKSSLEEGKTIERIKSKLIRKMASVVSDDNFKSLNSPLVNLKKTAEKLGLELTDISAKIDIKENPYTGNSIALHDDSLPYRLHGKGSKRLMSIAIQTELTKQGGIVLIDELEQGLEPDRIITLIRILKETGEGQVFITTHSLNVILEADWHNLFVVNKSISNLAQVSESLDGCRRSNPQVFFAKKIICCEGKTELGFIRALDWWLSTNSRIPFSANGIVIANAGGGNKMYTYALKLKQLGFDVCVFADDDKSSELKNAKEQTVNANIPLFLCEEGNDLETQIFSDIPWDNVLSIVKCAQYDVLSLHIDIPTNIDSKLCIEVSDAEKLRIRKELADLSTKKKKEWFKNIPGGEFLGKFVMNNFDDLSDECTLKKNILSLISWCGF